MIKNEDLEQLGTIMIKNIRDVILDEELSQSDTIYLHKVNYEDILLEYRTTYGESMPIPFFFLRVLIEIDKTGKLKENKYKVIKDDAERTQDDYLLAGMKELMLSDLSYEDKIIYRCGYCGCLTDANGNALTGAAQAAKSNIWKMFEKQVGFKKTEGRCCEGKGIKI